MRTLIQDIRYGFRMLFRNPGFTVMVVLVLAMGIGANTVIFSVVNAVLLRPLPYPEPEQLVRIKELGPPGSILERFHPGTVHTRLYQAWREQSQMSSQIAAYGNYEGTLTGGDYPERITGGYVSANFFSVLGVQPARGRTFDPAEDQPDGPPVAVVSHGLWVRRFGGDPDLVGKGIITLDDKSYTVVGILPASFKFPEPFEVWLPLAQARGKTIVCVIGRLKPGLTVQQATVELETILRRLPRFRDGGFHVTVVGLQEQIVGNVRLMLLVLQAVVGFVLLIACANVANLLLARANNRRREVATRVALGAGRGRVLRLLLTENTLLAFAGGGFGLFIACLGLNVSRVVIAPFVPVICPIRLDASVLGFTLLISLLTSVVGLVPALEVTRLDLNKALKPGNPGQTGHLRGPRLRDILVVSEVTLALVLFIGSGLLIKSFLRLRSVNLGFQPEGVLTAQIRLHRGQSEVTFFEQLFERIQALPGVQSVAVGDHLPMTGYARVVGLEIEGRQASNLSTNSRDSVVIVSPEYFRSLGIPLLQGRFFNSGDAAGSTNVALINETLARHYFAEAGPIGKRINQRWTDAGPCAVVGVVGDARQSGLDSDVLPQIYLPYTQYGMGARPKLVIRAVGDPLRLAGPMRDVLKSIDSDVAASDIMTMEQRLAKSIASRRVNMFLTGAFAGLALLLAVAGIYGVMSYLVSQRTHEFGIRIALGAQASDVLKLVVRQGMKLAFIGVAVGLAASFALTRVISSFLYNVSPTDPLTFICVSLLLAGVALVASYIPARRAAKIDPMEALRYE